MPGNLHVRFGGRPFFLRREGGRPNLLGGGLLYTGSGITNLDSVYTFVSMYVDGLVKNASETLYLIIKVCSDPDWVNPESLSTGFIIVSVGYLFKISAAPFHFWSPDIYDAIPTIVTTIVSSLAKITISMFLLEIVYYTGQPIFGFN